MRRVSTEETVTSVVDEKAFQLGHVFKAEELPEAQKHLAGWLYYADNKIDGTMCLVETKDIALNENSVDTFYVFEEHVEALRSKGHADNTCIALKEDFNALRFSGHEEKAELEGKYWVNSREMMTPDYAHVYTPSNDDLDYYRGKGSEIAASRIFQNVPQFKPI